MFLISLTTISALGVIAGGSFWTAQSMYRITDNSNRVMTRMCVTAPDASFGGMAPTFSGIPIPQCP